MKETSLITITEPQADYELIDSGDEQKLERFGAVILARPDPQALWKKSAPQSEWHRAAATFSQQGKSAKWVRGTSQAGDTSGGELPEEWNMKLGDFTFLLGLSSFKHTGIFPEHLENWKWIGEAVAAAQANIPAGSFKKISVLNLFGYTGGATLAALAAGADVCHVDGSKVSIARAKENVRLSGLAEKPVRFILDDALAFVKREARRGNKYDAIIMDPPAFGRGAKGEVWKIERDLPVLMDACREIFSADPVFILLNGYAAGYSPLAYRNNIAPLLPASARGDIECGELAIRESRGGRLLPAGMFARWRRV